jgi:hypothetical protein
MYQSLTLFLQALDDPTTAKKLSTLSSSMIRTTRFPT